MEKRSLVRFQHQLVQEKTCTQVIFSQAPTILEKESTTDDFHEIAHGGSEKYRLSTVIDIVTRTLFVDSRRRICSPNKVTLLSWPLSELFALPKNKKKAVANGRTDRQT